MAFDVRINATQLPKLTVKGTRRTHRRLFVAVHVWKRCYHTATHSDIVCATTRQCLGPNDLLQPSSP